MDTKKYNYKKHVTYDIYEYICKIRKILLTKKLSVLRNKIFTWTNIH